MNIYWHNGVEVSWLPIHKSLVGFQEKLFPLSFVTDRHKLHKIFLSDKS